MHVPPHRVRNLARGVGPLAPCEPRHGVTECNDASAALAAGYVRPYLDRPTGAGPEARLLVLLDVSASMQAREREGVRM